MKTLLQNDYIVLIIRIILGMVFLVASIDKIADPAAFAVSIGNYKLVPETIGLLLATVLPWVELLCGLGLIFGIAWRGSALLSFLMLCIFTVAVISALARGLDISCGCFTQDPTVGQIGWQKAGENILMVVGSLFLVFSGGDRFTIQRYFISRLEDGSSNETPSI